MNFAPSPKSASVIAREARQSKGRNRHLPHQTDALNEVFERTEHPSLEERTDLAQRLGMETKVVNSWFQNKRASVRKKSQRTETPPSSTPVASQSPPPLAADLPAVPPRSQHPSLPPRSQHPSLPPIANLLHGSPPPAASIADTDPEDDNMKVQLPPIRENAITRPAFLSPKLAAVCLPHPLPEASAGLTSSSQGHGPLGSSHDLRGFPPPLSLSRGGSPRAVSDSFPERRVRQSRGYDPIGLSGRHPTASPISHTRLLLRDASPLVPSIISNALNTARSESQAYSREPSVEVDELMDDSPAPSVASHGISHKARRRPSPEQLEQLRRTFDVCTHPSREERERLAEVTGMRLQSVANWFQHQRSMAKRRGGTASTHVTKPVAKPEGPYLSRATSPAASINTRPKRSRPEQYQLNALKELYTETATPTMEQRAELATQLGMTESKVTNWFRNARQTAKKKNQPSQLATTSNAAHSGSDGELDEDHHDAPISTRGRDSLVITNNAAGHTSASPSRESNVFITVHHDKYPASADDMDVDEHDSASHTGSDEDEIPTPSPLSSTQPLYHAAPKNASTVDDAALLLNFRTSASS